MSDENTTGSLGPLQRLALSFMGSLIVLTFLMSNVYGRWWQLSEWLVATILPAVVVDLTNTERTSESITPLRRNTQLDAAATKKAEHMARYGYFAHYAPDGTTPWEFFDAVGYVYAHAGENLAVHFTDSSALVAAWMRSPSHRENIVSAQFSEIGVGTARGRYQGHETVFVVQLFGTPAAPPPVAAAAPVPTPVPSTPVPVAASTETTGTEVASVAATTAVELQAETVAVGSTADESVAQEEALLAAPPRTPLGVGVDTVAAPSELSAGTSESPAATPADPEQDSAPEILSEPDFVTVEAPTVLAPAWLPGPTFLSVSSGLPPLAVAYADGGTSGTTAIALATQPQRLLQVLYTALSLVVIWLLVTSAVRDVRQQRLVRVGYSALLLGLMSGLVWLHVQLTSGVVIT